MVKPRVYVETTIPSFYHETRTTPDILARREWTREWWRDATGHDELVIRRVNGMLGLFVPAIVTPLELLGGSDEPGSK